jgi:hypothetical protein
MIDQQTIDDTFKRKAFIKKLPARSARKDFNLKKTGWKLGLHSTDAIRLGYLAGRKIKHTCCVCTLPCKHRVPCCLRGLEQQSSPATSMTLDSSVAGVSFIISLIY